MQYSSSPLFGVQDWTGNYMQICWELGGSFTTFNPIEEDQYSAKPNPDESTKDQVMVIELRPQKNVGESKGHAREKHYA